MKLKKIESTEMDESGATAIGDPFKLDAAPVQSGPAGVNRTAALIAFLASLAAAAMVGAVAAMMYVNWELIAEA